MPANGSEPTPISPSRSQVTAALQRAAERARLIAEQTGTKLVVSVPQPKPAVPVQKPSGSECA